MPLGGSGSFSFAGATYPVARTDVFTAKPHVLYLPPRTMYAIAAVEAFEVAIGSAPAEGRYPARLLRSPGSCRASPAAAPTSAAA